MSVIMLITLVIVLAAVLVARRRRARRPHHAGGGGVKRLSVLIALLAVTTPALAEKSEKVGTRVPSLGRVAGNPLPLSEFDQTQARKAVALFGECVVKRSPSKAVNYLLRPNLDKDARIKLVEKLDLGNCLVDVVESQGDLMMELPGDTLRYALAEPLVRARFGALPVLDFKTIPPLIHQTFNEEEFQPKAGERRTKAEALRWEESKLARKGAIFMSAFGECVVRTDPANSRALILASIGSPEEKQRFRALAPSFGGCMPADHRLSIDRAVIRGTIANNYFRLASAAAAAGAAR